MMDSPILVIPKILADFLNYPTLLKYRVIKNKGG